MVNVATSAQLRIAERFGKRRTPDLRGKVTGGMLRLAAAAPLRIATEIATARPARVHDPSGQFFNAQFFNAYA
jgi:hypothetical protein